MVVFDGRAYQQKLLRRLRRRWRQLPRRQRQRRLVSLWVGNNPASQLYLRYKQEFAQKIGISFVNYHLDNQPARVKEEMARLAADPNVAGLMVQLPLPSNWSPQQRVQLLNKIPAEKDVDGLTAVNLGRLLTGESSLLPAAVGAIITILAAAGLPRAKLAGRVACVVGKSQIVGLPLVNWLAQAGATVLSCDQYTRSLARWTRRADILISATGQPGLIKGTMVAPGAVAIDVGSPRGDFVFPAVARRARWLTPVPGGVGPLTVAMLMANFLQILFAAARLEIRGEWP